MPFTDGYEPIAPAGQSPGAAPGTEKTNENRPSPGPSWSRATAKGACPGKPSSGGGEGGPSDTY
jgi:hypothetical protein